MSTAESDDDKPSQEQAQHSRQRLRKITLPVDPSDEELARDWTLSEADCDEALRCRGESNRRRFSVQLCMLRRYGCFLNDYESIPVRIVNHLSRQLNLPPTLFINEPERHATESEYQARLRQYLGYRSFDQEAQQSLTNWLEARATEGMLPSDLLERA